MDLTEANVRYARFMLRLADHIAVRFPQYAGCLRNEIQGRRMTNERWNRVTAALSSLAALPGSAFRQDEHDTRNPALSAIVISQKMATVMFGGHRIDVKMCLELCDSIVADLDGRILTEGSRSG